jgi:hypothetical protein
VGSRDCATGLENFNLSMVVARRIPLIGEEAQIVLASGVFYPPPGLAVPNWPPYDGNWPLAESIVPAPAPPR